MSFISPNGAFHAIAGVGMPFSIVYLKGFTMSRHVLFLEDLGLAVHAGFDKPKDKLYAKIYPIHATQNAQRLRNFKPNEIEKLKTFLLNKGIEAPQAFLDAIATDVQTDDHGNRVWAWSKTGSIDLAEELAFLH
jgi:hypothetical protein